MPKGLRTKEHAAIRAAIAGLMQKKNLEQQDLAKKLGWAKSTVSRLLSGERSCSAVEFVKIARAMGEQPSTLWKMAEAYL